MTKRKRQAEEYATEVGRESQSTDEVIGLINKWLTWSDDAPDVYRTLSAARDEINRLRLTDEERAALMWFSHYGLPERRAASLRKLLARLK
jgi:hypothetical protein